MIVKVSKGMKILPFVFRRHTFKHLSTTTACLKYNCPPSSNELQRAGGIATVMRLPYQETSNDLDACFVGIPLDSGASYRSGTRFGPRQIRTESAFVRPYNADTGAAPFESMQIADVGDLRFNIYNIHEACEQIKAGMLSLVKNGCKPLVLGGDHTLSYPVLQAVKEKWGPVGLVHIDAHSDTDDNMWGSKIAHGTPFRRAVEDGCLLPNKVVQIGIRGSGYTLDDYKWARDQGFRIVLAKDCWQKSLVPLMDEVTEMMGDCAVYISFDIDGLDPAFAPGTGTPEIAGLTSMQGLQIIRGCKGLNVIGGDLVEVSPPYDTTGTTALTAANLLFEMLCVLPEVKYLAPA